MVTRFEGESFLVVKSVCCLVDNFLHLRLSNCFLTAFFVLFSREEVERVAVDSPVATTPQNALERADLMLPTRHGT